MSRVEPEIGTKSPEIIPLRGHLFSTKCKELQTLDGQTVALRSQSAEVLATLAARAGEIVSKDEIIAAVWADTFVTDDSLVQCITDIRRALGDTTHEIVETFTKRGYRLNIDPVGRVASAAKNDTALPAGGTRRRTIVVSLVAAVALVAVALAFLGNRLQPEWGAPGDTPRIAVLPFDDFSTGEDKGYLSDAIAEGIITELSRSKTYAVIARNSSFRYRDQPTDARQIGDELGVGYLLEGSQQKIADRLRVTVQWPGLSPSREIADSPSTPCTAAATTQTGPRAAVPWVLLAVLQRRNGLRRAPNRTHWSMFRPPECFSG